MLKKRSKCLPSLIFLSRRMNTYVELQFTNCISLNEIFLNMLKVIQVTCTFEIGTKEVLNCLKFKVSYC